MRTIVFGIMGLVPLVVSAQSPKAGTPEGAAQAFKTAVDQGDLKTVAELTLGDGGVTLRRLVEPYTKAKAASDKLDKALRERPSVGHINPFAASVTPLADTQCEIIEITKLGAKTVLRLKFGLRGKAQEETVQLIADSGTWRLDPPAELAKQLRLLGGEREGRFAKGLDKLAELLDVVAGEVQDGKLRTKEEVLLRMVRLFDDAKIGELLG